MKICASILRQKGQAAFRRANRALHRRIALAQLRQNLFGWDAAVTQTRRALPYCASILQPNQ